MRRTPRLVDLLFEDASEEIEQAFKSGPAAVRSLANSAKDKEDLKSSLKGSFDKQDKDDVVSVTPGATPAVNDLIPTQKEIDLVKSIGWPMGDLDTLEKMITTKTSTAPGSISVSGNLVIDGHHRWSSIFAISGPTGTVKVDDISLPGKTQAEKLAAAQLAIAAYKPADSKQPAAEGEIEKNILGASSETVEKMLLDAEGEKDPDAPGIILNPKFIEGCSNSKIVADWAGFEIGADAETVKNALAKKVGQNLAQMKSNPDAPARPDMPQFDHKAIGGKTAKAAIIQGLQSGEFNVSPPFGPTEAARRNDAAIMERWARLAGILKD